MNAYITLPFGYDADAASITVKVEAFIDNRDGQRDDLPHGLFVEGPVTGLHGDAVHEYVIGEVGIFHMV